MESVLEDLYNGNICPAAQFRYTLDDVREKWEKMDKAELAFMESLSAPMKKQFDDIMDARLDMACLDLSQAYVEGFKMGAKFLIEVFTSESFGDSKKEQ